MTKTKKNGYERIIDVLNKKYAAKGLTRAQIAEKAGLNPNSTGPYLTALKQDGVVQIVGKLPQKGLGRPQQLYAKA